MTKEVQEFNKLCAEFLGWEYIDKDLHPQAYENYGWWVKGTYTNNINARNNSNWKGFDSDLKFHSDWNWIMLVIDNIEKIISPIHGRFGVFISINSCCIQGKNFNYGKSSDVYYSESYADTKIQAVIKEIHKFLLKKI